MGGNLSISEFGFLRVFCEQIAAHRYPKFTLFTYLPHIDV